jgi:hypothetical protein
MPPHVSALCISLPPTMPWLCGPGETMEATALSLQVMIFYVVIRIMIYILVRIMVRVIGHVSVRYYVWPISIGAKLNR